MTTEELKALAERYFDETIVYWTGQKCRSDDMPLGFQKLMDLVKEVQRRTRKEALGKAAEVLRGVPNEYNLMLRLAEEDSER